MGPVSSSAGVASLLQILSASGSPVVSSPALMSDLENASPEDIIQISISAIQLQGMDTLLGIASGDTSDGSALSSIIRNMTASQTLLRRLPRANRPPVRSPAARQVCKPRTLKVSSTRN
jgi:hypothetical protein